MTASTSERSAADQYSSAGMGALLPSTVKQGNRDHHERESSSSASRRCHSGMTRPGLCSCYASIVMGVTLLPHRGRDAHRCSSTIGTAQRPASCAARACSGRAASPLSRRAHSAGPHAAQDHQDLLCLTRVWSALYEKVQLASAEALQGDQARLLYCEHVRRMEPAITREERRIVRAVAAARRAQRDWNMDTYARAIGVEEAARARLARLWSRL